MPVENLNELEYVKGEIYANIWKSDRIARISPETGLVTGWIDLAGILAPLKGEMLNGIAYDPEGDRLFVTGTPIVTGWVLAHAWEIGFSMIGAVVLIFGLLWAYFRRWHGVLIPSVAATVTAIWGLGFIGWRRRRR